MKNNKNVNFLFVFVLSVCIDLMYHLSTKAVNRVGNSIVWAVVMDLVKY